MNMLNVGQSLDMSCQTAENRKTGNGSGEVKDDFKNLLQGKNEESKDVSKDTVKQKKDDGQKVQEKEPEKEEKSQSEGLLAAYQMSQNLRPEMIQVEPEQEPVADVISTEAVSLLEGEAGTPALETVVSSEQQPVMVQGDVQVKAEAVEVVNASEKPEVVSEVLTDTEPKVSELPKNTVKARNEDEGKPQSENQDAQQTAAAVMTEAPVRIQTQTEVPQETVTVQVRQPEELPEQVTDQILTKMADGIDEFEIHIEPENLGKIAVKISYQQGEANISLICSERKAVEVLGNNLKEICGVIERNFGGQTTVIVEKPENDYLNQTRDDNGQGRQDAQQEHKEGKKEQSEDDAEQFLQKLRLGLAG